MSQPVLHALRRCLRRASVALLLAASALAVSGGPAHAAGPYAVRWSEPADLRNHTVYRPSVPAGVKLPVLLWGQGGCLANGLLLQDFLREVASHGILVVASGGPYQVGTTTWGYMARSIDWAKAQNALPGGQYQGRLIADRVAASGWSCGGLEALTTASNRPEIAALALMNSGQLQPNQAQLDRLTAPTLYVLGGSGDVAYANGSRDFNRLPSALPAFLASNNAGHLGTYFSPQGGVYAAILRDWVLWRINGSAAAAKRFVGADCTLCTSYGWEIRKRNID